MGGEWSGETTPYGPVWEVVDAAAARVAPEDMAGVLVALKVAGLLALMGSSAVLWLLLRDLPENRRAAYVILWAWNPALLLTFVMDAHNDGLMLLWLLLGALAMERKRPVIGLLLVVMAILTKPIAALALPVFLVSEWRQAGNLQARLRLTLGTAAGTLLLVGLTFLPWAGRGGWLAGPTALALRLTREATAGAGFSPATFVYFVLQGAGLTVSVQSIGTVFLALFAVFFLLVLWKTWRGQPAAPGVAGVFAGYIVQALNFRIWYAAWPFPFLIRNATMEERDGAAEYWLRVGFWFLLTTQLSVVVYSHIRLELLGGSHPLAHLIGVPFTFLLPLLLARWSWWPTSEASVDEGHLTPSPDPLV
ncbi:MAG: hypothetical protein R3C44_04450 [Chloroflexota bacterium]